MKFVLVSITKSPKLFLSCGIPHIEDNGSIVRMEAKRMHFYTKRGNVFLLKFSSQMSLYKCRLSDTAVTDKDELTG